MVQGGGGCIWGLLPAAMEVSSGGTRNVQSIGCVAMPGNTVLRP